MTESSSSSIVNSTTPNNSIISNSSKEDDNFDLFQDIARSAFADMLWDQERNYLYKIAVQKVLGKLLNEKGLESLRFYDIGVGTGLLSMFMYNTIKDYVVKNNLPESQFLNKKIIGYETFEPTYVCANKIIKNHFMDDIIHLFNEFSVKENPNIDEKEKGCFLVSEVFDTELIGESAIEIFNNAKKNYLLKDAITVPKKARIYCQLIENRWLCNGSIFRPADLNIGNKNFKIFFPKCINKCPGSTIQLNDIQLNCLKIEELKIISDIVIAFEFDFSNLEDKKTRSKVLNFKIINKFKFYTDVCIAFWWDLQMDDDDEIILSCAPYWARYDINYNKILKTSSNDDISIFFDHSIENKKIPVEEKLKNLNEFYENELIKYQNDNVNENFNFFTNFERIRLAVPWRDHWMQAIYFFPANSNLSKFNIGSLYKVIIHHNLYTFWFEHFKGALPSNEVVEPSCHCGYHLELSRSSLRLLNENHIRNLVGLEIERIFLRYQYCYLPFRGKKKMLRESMEVFVFGEFGYSGILAAKITPKSKVYVCKEFTKTSFMQQQFLTQGLKCKFEILPSLIDFCEPVDLVIKEPCYDQSQLPWHDLHKYLKCYRTINRKTSSMFYVDAIPSVIDIKVMPVCFDHLWKIRLPIKKIENYDIRPFHDLIEENIKKADASVEMISLYEYDGICLDKPATLAKIKVKEYNTHKSCNTVSFTFNCEEILEKLTRLYGINQIERNLSIFNQQLKEVCPFRRTFSNISFVFWLNYNYNLSTGPHLKPKVLEQIVWNRNFKQGVYFMPEYDKDNLSLKKSLTIELNVEYDFFKPEGHFVLKHEEIDLKLL